MEMQLFILGHVLLLAISMVVGGLGGDKTDPEVLRSGGTWVGIFLPFIPLEIIYWVLDWYFVP